MKRLKNTKPKAKPNGWGLDEISLMIEWEESKKLQSQFVVPQDYVIFKYRSAINQAILSAEKNLLREIMEEMPKKIDEVIVGAFLDVAGTVWGIDAPDRRWTDKQMTYFNVKIVEIRDKTIDQVNTLLERKLSTVKKT